MGFVVSWIPLFTYPYRGFLWLVCDKSETVKAAEKQGLESTVHTIHMLIDTLRGKLRKIRCE